jgi:hypothetical protein
MAVSADLEVIKTNPLELEWTDDLADLAPEKEMDLKNESL